MCRRDKRNWTDILAAEQKNMEALYDGWAKLSIKVVIL